MAVKHYVDEIPPYGGRTYKINGVTSTVEDVTAYQQEGSGFGAADVNATCVLECNYTKNGTVHELTTQNTTTENLKFYTTAAYNRGDTFMLNGITLDAKTLGGHSLDTNFFQANTMVECFLRNGTLFFTGQNRIDAAANLLNNSDFTNPINQREQTTYSTSGQYTFDRWMLTAPSGGTVSVGSGYVGMYTEGDYVDIQQALERASLMTGKAYTFAVMLNGASAPYLLNFTFGTAASASFMDGQVALIHYNSDRVIIRVAAKQSWIGFTWAALYEGTYTADTLPNYAPKGYAAELAECKRYFEKVTGGMFAVESNKSTLTCVRGYSPKRIAPTLSFSVGDSLLLNCPGVGESTVTVSSVDASAEYFDHISINESLTAGDVYVYNYTVSADL